jgi:hypothetical protein
MLDLDCPDAAVEAAPADIGPQAAPAPARAFVEQQLRMLTRLAEVGLNIAGAVERRALAEASAPGAADQGCDWGLVYSRIARAVRLTIALQSKLLKDLAAFDEAGAGQSPAADGEATAEHDRAALRTDRIGRIAQRVVEAEIADKYAAERLSNTMWERLDDEDIYGEVLERPIGEIVALICKDLGLSPDWRRWAHEAWALAEAQTGAPGSPFAGHAAAVAAVGEPSPDTGPPMGFTPQAASP